MSRADQSRVLKLISRHEALRLLAETFHGYPRELKVVPCWNALGRKLAEDVISETDVPTCDRAAMDGYAVRSLDVVNASQGQNVKLQVVGELSPLDGAGLALVGECQAMFVSCGSPMPEGSDCVVKVEETRRTGNEVEVAQPVQPGKNISFAGEDVRRGTTILTRGRILRPQDIGALIAIGKKNVKVTRQPRVAILSVGDELVDLALMDNGKTVNNYAYVISGLLAQLDAIPIMLGVCPDETSEIARMISHGLKEADIVLTMGGCSVGIKDLVPDAVMTLRNHRIVFHGVAIAPGKVTGVAEVDGKPVVMLPGYVVSAVVGFFLFTVPLLNIISGVGIDAPRPCVNAKITARAAGRPAQDLFLLVKVTQSEESWTATPLLGYVSVLRELLQANGFTIVSAGKKLLQGEIAEINLFSALDFESMCVKEGVF